jgi:uncharacterized membrane protein YphA (DoxX/SURF4 family)
VFPDGRTGLGLLLLRTAVGIVVLIEGAAGLVHPDPAVRAWVIGSLAVASGIALLVGFLTPIAAAVVAVIASGVWMSMLPGLSPNLFTSKPSCAFLTGVAAVIVLVGPGAFSLDARLFGLREIIIPRSRPDA